MKVETVEKKKESCGKHAIALTGKKSPVVRFEKPAPKTLKMKAHLTRTRKVDYKCYHKQVLSKVQE